VAEVVAEVAEAAEAAEAALLFAFLFAFPSYL
jgi:hypothetical protein